MLNLRIALNIIAVLQGVLPGFLEQYGAASADGGAGAGAVLGAATQWTENRLEDMETGSIRIQQAFEAKHRLDAQIMQALYSNTDHTCICLALSLGAQLSVLSAVARSAVLTQHSFILACCFSAGEELQFNLETILLNSTMVTPGFDSGFLLAHEVGSR